MRPIIEGRKYLKSTEDIEKPLRILSQEFKNKKKTVGSRENDTSSTMNVIVPWIRKDSQLGWEEGVVKIPR